MADIEDDIHGCGPISKKQPAQRCQRRKTRHTVLVEQTGSEWYEAWLENNPTVRSGGDTPAHAIGNLIYRYREQFGIHIDIRD